MEPRKENLNVRTTNARTKPCSPLLDPRESDNNNIDVPQFKQQGRLRTAGCLVAEDDEGSVEYKWRLTNIPACRFEHLVTQMKFRVSEGCGQCMYEIGVADNGNPRGLQDADFDESIATVRRMADRLGFICQVNHERVVSTVPCRKRCAELIVTKSATEIKDLRVAFCGTTEAGKSTLVGVLVHGALDDGSGSSRQGVFKHKHEVNSGRTSSVAHHVLGFDETGRVTNYEEEDAENAVYGGATLTAAENTTRTIAERSVKLVTLMDLCGDGKYAKTSILGMTSRNPGAACICIAVDQPVDEVRQYLNMALHMRIPCFIVVTKVDLVTEIELDDFQFDLSAELGKCNVEGLVVDESNLDKAWRALDPSTDAGATAPIFFLSSVEGTGVELLKRFFHQLPAADPPAISDPNAIEVLLDSSVTQLRDVGFVVTGYIAKGCVRVGSEVLIGPDRRGGFQTVVIESIHVKGNHTMSAAAGCEASFAIGTMPPPFVDLSRKGNVLISAAAAPNICREFEIEAEVLTNDTVTVGQEPIVHCRNIRQAARIVATSQPESGALTFQDNGILRCRFLFGPEVLDINSVVVLRWGRHAKIIGRVCKVYALSPSVSPLQSPNLRACQSGDYLYPMTQPQSPDER